MTNKGKVTITDVAKAAKVAVGTVSRVLNNHPDVHPDIQERVWQTAHRLRYRRIRQRRTAAPREAEVTRSGRAGDIGMVCFGMEDTLVQLPIVSTALQGIENALSAQGRSLLLANIPRGDRIPPFVAEGQVKGVILKGPNQGDLPMAPNNELLRALYRLPHVWLMGRLPHAQGDHCNFDTDRAGQIVADHLYEKGHRRVAFLNPKPGQTQFEKVKHSYMNACERYGAEVTILETEKPEVIEWPLPAITLQENVDRLVQRWASMPAKSRPTALFVPSDRTAVQLYSSLERLSLQVGKDVSVISCNNEKALHLNLSPALTTVDVHAENIGRRAVDQLLWRIAHPEETLSVQILVEPTLAIGESVGDV
jgi:LacI family transcriptional regulator